ncbi:MAG: iron-sulfur cluster assembly protein [Rhodothalassiaceae bacterium]
MSEHNKDRDVMDVADSQQRPVFTPQIGSEFMRNFLKPNAAAEAEAESEAPAQTGPKTPEEVKANVIAVLRDIYDPEIPVNIYELGLVYDVDVDADLNVLVTMTLTTPHCPVAETMPGEVEQKCAAAEGAAGARVNLVWEPAWDMTRMSDEARLELGLL